MLGGGGITNVCIMCLPAHRLRCRWHSEALMCESARRRIETIVENSEESTEQEYERRCLGERESGRSASVAFVPVPTFRRQSLCAIRYTQFSFVSSERSYSLLKDIHHG